MSLVVAATAAVLAATAWWTVRFLRLQLVHEAIAASSAESDRLRVALEAQMIAGDRTLLRRLVESIGREPNTRWVGLLDHEGRVRIASDPAAEGQVFDRASPDCQICHAHAAADRQRSVTLVRSEGDLLRTVTPLLNREVCHVCHDASRRVNGVLIIDRSLGPIQLAVNSGQDQVLLGSLLALIALLASLGLGIERLVLSRIERLRRAAHELGHGAWTGTSDRSTDELGELAREFDTMGRRLAAALSNLAAERRQLDELVNGIADGVALLDPALRVVTVNRAFAARLSPGAAVPSGASYPQAVQGTTAPAERALASGRLEKEIVRREVAGEEHYDEVYAQPLHGPNGTVTAVIEVWRDITDRKALEAGLEQAERLAAIGMLASAVAHEVGNPLASIATAVEVLQRRLDEPAGIDAGELREYLEIVRKQVFRCRGVTERLLGFARLPSQRVTQVDAAAAAREVMALVGPQARVQNVEVKSELAAPALAMAEDLLLEQVFLNLILNALQAMPKGGELRVTAKVTTEAVLVVVADTGPGMPDAVLRHLFEPFRRGGAPGVGTGLGLFLSHTLVRRCGGTLTVESQPGQGTAFTVRLRRAPDAAIQGGSAGSPGRGAEPPEGGSAGSPGRGAEPPDEGGER